MKKKQSKEKVAIKIATIGVLLLIPIGILAGCATADPSVQETPRNEAAYPASGTSVPVPSTASATPVSLEVERIQTYTELLKGENLSEEMRSSLLTKIAIYSRVATQQAMIKETPLLSTLPTMIPVTDVPMPTGLTEGGTSDFHTWEAVIQNTWAQYVNNNEHVLVYAGELGLGTESPGRGVVFVLRRTPDKRVRSFNRYLLPEGTGWVRISEIKGDYLVLTSKEGKTFYFYIPGQQLVSSLTGVTPTVTPLPTALPLPTLGPLPTQGLSSYPYPEP